MSDLSLPRVIMPRSAGSDEWVLLRNPVRIVVAWKPGDVLSCLDEVSKAGDDGLYAAGFVSYEAASGCDSALVTHPSGNLPLLWFGIFSEAEPYDLDLQQNSTTHVDCDWTPNVSRMQYDDAIENIHSY
ncbi:MAG: hypothetical protein KAI74_00925, partial [Kiritimatiellae bacterium]|nr:hypothetical protein [Kiritimatiellia bacterium]